MRNRWKKEIPQLLATLDSILVQTGELASQKELKIAQLKKKLSNAANLEEEFWINKCYMTNLSYSMLILQ